MPSSLRLKVSNEGGEASFVVSSSVISRTPRWLPAVLPQEQVSRPRSEALAMAQERVRHQELELEQLRFLGFSLLLVCAGFRRVAFFPAWFSPRKIGIGLGTCVSSFFGKGWGASASTFFWEHGLRLNGADFCWWDSVQNLWRPTSPRKCCSTAGEFVSSGGIRAPRVLTEASHLSLVEI